MSAKSDGKILEAKDYLTRVASNFVRFNEPLSKHTYYKIGGPADLFAIPENEMDLKQLFDVIGVYKIPFFILGLGSNLLVSDQGFRGLVIKNQKVFDRISDLSPSRDFLKVGSSVMNVSALRFSIDQGISGLEFLAGIPGTIGGAVAMNAGTTTKEVKDSIKSVNAYVYQDGQFQLKTFDLEASQFDYRRNLFLPNGSIVCSAVFHVEQSTAEQVKRAIDQKLKKRSESQPVTVPSCGSVFRNPIQGKVFAWQVIDQLGLRGFRKGDAMFSEKHPNFIVNLGKAKAIEVYDLIQLAKRRASNEMQIQLEEEVKFLGEF